MSAALALLAGCGGLEGDAGAGPGGPSGPTGATGPGGSAAATQAAWLAPHNQVRAGTFPGVTVSPTPSPALPALTWSASATGVAQAWADGCVWGHNPVRNPDGVARGENIAASSPGHWDEAGVVGAWASEWVGYD
jgi:pathogenesis-related protein 1